MRDFIHYTKLVRLIKLYSTNSCRRKGMALSFGSVFYEA
jgi:hypothetical protein